jgi:hypothetical protein
MINELNGVFQSIMPVDGIEKLKDAKQIAVIVAHNLHHKLKQMGVTIELADKYKKSRGAVYLLRWRDSTNGMDRIKAFDSFDVGLALSMTAQRMGVKYVDACHYKNVNKMERQFRSEHFGGPGWELLFDGVCQAVDDHMNSEIEKLMEP